MGSRAMWAKATVENCLSPVVTVLGGFTLLDGPQIQEMRKCYKVPIQHNIHTVENLFDCFIVGVLTEILMVSIASQDGKICSASQKDLVRSLPTIYSRSRPRTKRYKRNDDSLHVLWTIVSRPLLMLGHWT